MEVIALTCVRINQGRRQKELATITGFELPQKKKKKSNYHYSIGKRLLEGYFLYSSSSTSLLFLLNPE